MSSPERPAAKRTGYSPALCAHTDFECDCDCTCGAYQGNPSHECDWPDCACGCDAACIGCRLVQEAAA